MLTPKLWPKIEIQDGGCPPSCIFEKLVSEHCHLGQPIFHHYTKLGAKMLIDAEIMAQHRNPRWRPSDVLKMGVVRMLFRCLVTRIIETP